MVSPVLRPPTPDDAGTWFDFLVEQQAVTYAGLVPDDFRARQDAFRAGWVPGLAESFAGPGTARRLVAEVDGRLVGVASIADAPASWEIQLGLVPAPAARQLERLYVDQTLQGTGLASAMFEAIDDGRDLYLWLIDGNRRAHRFYHRNGFVDLDESLTTGPSWGNIPMHRMLRRSGSPAAP